MVTSLSISMLMWIQSVFGIHCTITVGVDHKGVCRHMYIGYLIIRVKLGNSLSF